MNRFENIAGLIDEARHKISMAWCDVERGADPAQLLSALGSLECAMLELTALDRGLEREDAERASEPHDLDERSDVRASDAAHTDEIRGMVATLARRP